MAYTHVQGYGDEHRLAEEDYEWASKDVLQARAERKVIPFERRPIPVIACFFAFLLSTLHQDDGPGGKRQRTHRGTSIALLTRKSLDA